MMISRKGRVEVVRAMCATKTVVAKVGEDTATGDWSGKSLITQNI